MEKRDPLFQL
ncbi:unnamed protein product [Linum tenue]|uniref:Uncharacterized protein n=1 Tax=Linum tenue TaxID=586396 RepID=A0AAV0LJP0_9ROSI|nr:unnamed protein product [Linum tenue]